MELRISVQFFWGFAVGAVLSPEADSVAIALGIVSIAIQW